MSRYTFEKITFNYTQPHEVRLERMHLEMFARFYNIRPGMLFSKYGDRRERRAGNVRTARAEMRAQGSQWVLARDVAELRVQMEDRVLEIFNKPLTKIPYILRRTDETDADLRERILREIPEQSPVDPFMSETIYEIK